MLNPKKHGGYKMRKVFKSFDTLSVDSRAGVIISPTTKGLKVEVLTVYNDEPDKTYFIKATEDYNADSQWDAPINEYGTKLYDKLLHDINGGHIKPYRTIVK